MTMAVVCANGRVGRLIVEDAKKAGIDVTAIVRGKNETVADKSVSKDLFDLTTDDLKGYDVVVDAFGMWNPDHLSDHSRSLKHLTDILSGTKVHLYVVGGAGSLIADPKTNTRLVDTPDFPAEYKPLASAQAQQLDELRKVDDVDWTYISPAADFQADGKKTGKYSVGGDELMLNKKGVSEISYADYAQAFVDIIREGDHVHQRVSVVGEE